MANDYSFPKTRRTLKPVHVVAFDIVEYTGEVPFDSEMDKMSIIKDPLNGETYAVCDSNIRFIGGVPFLDERETY